VLDLSIVQMRLQQHVVLQGDPTQAAIVAAVALILRQGDNGELEMLYIERAQRDEDPWSGQMAFPGGRAQTSDPDLAATAAREVNEEIGMELGEPIGRLDDLVGGRPPDYGVLVAPYVHVIDGKSELRLNGEVRSSVWIPLAWILDPRAAVDYHFEREEFSGNFPAFRFQDHTVWGMTYRMTQNFLEILGRSLP